jgi:mRNA interferase MazF
MMLKKGMVVMVDLNPTKGSETGKIRPCVIVTNDVYNQRVPVIQVVPITEWNEKKVESSPMSPSNLQQKMAY